MSKTQILLPEWSLNATATSSNEEADAKASAIIKPRPSVRWRTLNLINMRATIDAGSSEPWDALFLGYTNATAVATLQVTADDNSANLFTTPAFDSTPFTLRFPGTGEFINYHAFYEAPSTQTYRYIGLEIIDAVNPDGYFQAGVLVVGELFTPSLEGQLGSSRGYQDTSISIQMANGESVKRRRPRKRAQRVTWAFLDESDSFFFDSLARVYGESSPFVLRRVPEVSSNFGQNLLLYGYAEFREVGTITDEAPYGFSGVELSMTEV